MYKLSRLFKAISNALGPISDFQRMGFWRPVESLDTPPLLNVDFHYKLLSASFKPVTAPKENATRDIKISDLCELFSDETTNPDHFLQTNMSIKGCTRVVQLIRAIAPETISPKAFETFCGALKNIAYSLSENTTEDVCKIAEQDLRDIYQNRYLLILARKHYHDMSGGEKVLLFKPRVGQKVEISYRGEEGKVLGSFISRLDKYIEANPLAEIASDTVKKRPITVGMPRPGNYRHS